MPKAKQKSVADDVEEETPLHGVINEEEVKTYRDGLETIFESLAKKYPRQYWQRHGTNSNRFDSTYH